MHAQESRLLRLKEVSYRVGLSRSTIYRKISEGQFPRPLQLSARAVAWPEGEIDTFISEIVANGGAK